VKNALALVTHPGRLNIDSAFLDNVWKRRVRSGEERLMLALLQDAIDCFFKYMRAVDPTGREIFAEAETWILKKDSDRIFSFENVCECLGLSPSYLRAELCRRQALDLQQYEAIFFNASNHRQTVRLSYSNFKKLVQPVVFSLTAERRKRVA
jgi:hypothetical protein